MKTLRHTIYAAMTLLALQIVPVACCNSDEYGSTLIPDASEMPDIILDTDLGNCTDDAAAMQAMFYYQSLGECNVVGVINSFKNNQAKRLIDGFLHYYKADDIPLGLIDGNEPEYYEIVPYCQLADSLKADVAPLFPSTATPLSSRLTGWKQYRKLLSEANDSSISIVCIGNFINLGLLLDSQADEYSSLTGMELVKKKVKRLHLTGGCFQPVQRLHVEEGDTSKYIYIEYNIADDVPLARKVIEGWPTDVAMLTLEAGMPFPSLHDSILVATKHAPYSPMYQIYSHYDEWAVGDTGQYMWDVLTLINAVKGNKLFDYSEKCTIDIDDEGHTTKTTSDHNNTIVINVKSSEEAKVWEIFWESLKWVP